MAYILVVDDESAVRDTIARQLTAMGHRCTEAGNGLEALERLHERDFDLILTDVMMPKLNGFQLLERALPYLKGRTPVIILSSVDSGDGVAAAIEAGAYDYLNKPAHQEDLERVISEGLARREEMLRLLGRPRGRGGPVPQDALGERLEDRAEAPVDQVPAGVPAVRTERRSLSVPIPDAEELDEGRIDAGPAQRSLWQRLTGWLRGNAAA